MHSIEGKLFVGQASGPVLAPGHDLMIDTPEGEVSLYQLLRASLGAKVQITITELKDDNC